MHKRLLGAALAMGALLAGSQANHPTQSAATDTNPFESKGTSITFAGRPVPAKSVSFFNESDRTVVAMKACQMAEMGSPVRFPQVPLRRKVKYGKSRWRQIITNMK
jgi:hypothetical protein